MHRSKKTSLAVKNPGTRKSQLPSLSKTISASTIPKLENVKDSNDSQLETSYSKSRSSSIISNPQSFIPTSPQYLCSTGKSLKQKLELVTPLLAKINEKNNLKSKFKRKLKTKEALLHFPKGLIEVRTIYEQTGVSQKVFALYEQFFSDIITQDKAFGGYLSEIKRVYDDWVSIHCGTNQEFMICNQEIFRLNQEIEKLTKKNQEIIENLESKCEDIKKLTRNLKYLCNENLQLGKKIEKISNSCKDLRNEFIKITQVSLDNIPVNPDSWKALIAGNKEYADLCKDLSKKIKSLEKREKKMLQALNPLKCTETQVKDSQGSQGLGSESVDDSYSDNEEIQRSKFHIFRSFPHLPKLDFTKLMPSSCSDVFYLDNEISIY